MSKIAVASGLSILITDQNQCMNQTDVFIITCDWWIH